MVILTQEEAQALIDMEKHKSDNKIYRLPHLGEGLCIPLISANRRERFSLDVDRGSYSILAIKYQTRARNVVPLIRLEIQRRPHTNPDGEKLSGTHFHLYQEGEGLRWASPVPENIFTDIENPHITLNQFLGYCNIVQPPRFERELF